VPAQTLWPKIRPKRKFWKFAWRIY